MVFCFRTELYTKSLFTTTSNVLPFKFKFWQQTVNWIWFLEIWLIWVTFKWPWSLWPLSYGPYGLYATFALNPIQGLFVNYVSILGYLVGQKSIIFTYFHDSTRQNDKDGRKKNLAAQLTPSLKIWLNNHLLLKLWFWLHVKNVLVLPKKFEDYVLGIFSQKIANPLIYRFENPMIPVALRYTLRKKREISFKIPYFLL